MEIYKYQVDKEIIKSRYGITPMEGRVVHNFARGYVFVNNKEEAYRTIDAKYESNEYERYYIHLEYTNMIEL